MLGMVLQGIGSMGLFSSRVFIPSFVAASILRFGPQLGLDAVGGPLNLLVLLGIDPGQTPTWFTHDVSIAVLGLLALLEVWATKNADARAVLEEIVRYGKPAMATVTYLGFASSADVAFVNDTIGVSMAGIGWNAILAPFVAAGTFFMASTRSAVLGTLADADEDDDLGIQKLISWAEDLWSAFGLLFLVLFPVVMVLLVLAVSGALHLWRKRAERKEDAARTPCPKCGTPRYAAAMACASCDEPNPQPAALTWLGQASTDRTAEIPNHPVDLATAKRCSHCATRLTERRLHQQCPACGRETFKAPDNRRQYSNRIALRLPMVLGLTAMLSAVPVLGLIPGVILYRVKLVAPFRRYIPRGRAVMAKWGLRLLFLLLVFLQLIPFVGIAMVPVMAGISFATYRSLFMRQADDDEPAPTTTSS